MILAGLTKSIDLIPSIQDISIVSLSSGIIIKPLLIGIKVSLCNTYGDLLQLFLEYRLYRLASNVLLSNSFTFG